MKEFWPENLTKASWEKLIKLNQEIDSVLIGGWAAYLHTGLHKSKNIDVIINYNTLAKLKEEYDIKKNDRLKKYEIELEKFDIEIYLPHYSKLSLPAKFLEKETIKLKGIKTLKTEPLLILKQGAEIDRRHSVKGEKDAIDILSICLRSNIDWKEYLRILKENNKENYREELIEVIRNYPEDNIKYLGIRFKDFKALQKQIINRLKEKI